MTHRIPLFCLLAACATASLGQDGESLIVRAGERVVLQAPQASLRVEAALDGGVLVPVDGGIEAPDSGDHWLAVASRDPLGRLSPLRWVLLRVDSAPPQVEMVIEPAPIEAGGRKWVPPGARAAVAARDAVAGVAEIRLGINEGVARSEGPRLDAALPTSGTVSLLASAVDRVGQGSAGQGIDLEVDSTPPEASFQVRGPAVESPTGWILAPNAQLNPEVADAESGLETWTATVDGQPVDPSQLRGPWPLGDHVARLEARDRVGNTAPAHELRFLVDGEGPDIAWQVATPGIADRQGKIFYPSQVELAVQASDSAAGLASLEGAAAGGASQPLEGGRLAVSGDRARLVAVDRVGNRTEVDAAWPVDVDGPEIRLSNMSGEPIASGSAIELRKGDWLRVERMDSGSGVAHVIYRLNGSRPRPAPQRIEFRDLGHFELEIEATDQVGNVSSAGWTLEVRKPPKRGV